MRELSREYNTKREMPREMEVMRRRVGYSFPALPLMLVTIIKCSQFESIRKCLIFLVVYPFESQLLCLCPSQRIMIMTPHTTASE